MTIHTKSHTVPPLTTLTSASATRSPAIVSVGELLRLPTIDRLAGDRALRTRAGLSPASRAAVLDARDFVTVRCERKDRKRKNSNKETKRRLG